MKTNERDDMDLIRQQMRAHPMEPLNIQMQSKPATKSPTPKKETVELDLDTIASLKSGYKALTDEIGKLAKEGILTLDELEEPIPVSALEIKDEILEQLAAPNRSADERLDLVGFSEQSLLTYYLIAKKLYEDKMLDEAVDAMCLLTHIGPQISPFWLGLGVAYEARQNWQQATEALQKAIEVNPADFTPFQTMIHIAAETHDFELVQELLEKHKETPEIKDEVETALQLLPQIMKGGQ